MKDQGRGDIRTEMFHRFLTEMNRAISENLGQDSSDQRTMMDKMFSLEQEFRDFLLSNDPGKALYDEFIRYVTEVKGNILSAQVYFRERQDSFYEKTGDSFETGRSRSLYKLRINYPFAQWAIDRYEGDHKRQLRGLFVRITNLRSKLIENNLPLAINRAKRFWCRVPESHMQYMDHIQAASEGLVTAIDKFVPNYGAFGHVAVGRITLNLLTEQNSTLIKFSPKERRILYRANNAKSKAKLSEEKDVTGYVGERFGGVTASDIAGISSAALNLTSLDSPSEDGRFLHDILPDHAGDPAQAAENADLVNKLRSAMSCLSVLERKIVRLKNGYA